MRTIICFLLALVMLLSTTVHAQTKRVFMRPASSQSIVTDYCVDSLNFTRQSQIDSFPITHPGCTTPKYITIDGTDASPAITSLAALSNIESAQDIFVKHVSVTTLSQMTSLRRVEGFLWVEDAPQLTSIGIQLEKVGLIILIGMPNLTSLSGLCDNLIETGIGTVILDNLGVTDFTGMDRLTSIPNLYVWGNQHLTSLHGLHNLQSLNSGISVFNNPLLTDISAFSNITRVEFGKLELSFLPLLTSFNGLQNITYLGRSFWMEHNPQITTLGELSPQLVIEDADGDLLRLKHNQQLEFCSFRPICAYLTAGGGSEIHDNSDGCNSPSEITDNCSADTVTWNGNESGDWDNANNWMPNVIPGAASTVIIPSDMSNSPYISHPVFINGLIMQPDSRLDLYGNDMTVTTSLNLYQAGIYSYSDTRLILKNMIDPYIGYSNIEPGIHLLNFTGNSLISGNYIFGDSYISDSTDGSIVNEINYNTFYKKLTLVSKGENTVTNFGNNNQENLVEGNTIFQNESSYSFNVACRFGEDVTVINHSPQEINFEKLQVGGFSGSNIFSENERPIYVQNFILNKPNGTNAYHTADIHLINHLNFFSGVLKSAPGKKVVFEEASGYSGGNNNTYIDGPVTRISNNAFVFPVGQDGFFAPLTMSAPGLGGDAFTVQYFHANPNLHGYDTTRRVDSLQQVSGKEYWTVERTNGNSTIYVSLLHDPARSEAVNTGASLRVTRWNGTDWTNQGAGVVSTVLGKTTVRTTQQQTDLGVYTFGKIEAYIPVITVGDIDAATCAGVYQGLKVPFHVDSSMTAGNRFYAQLSDASGSFANPQYIGEKITTTSDTILATIPFGTAIGNSYRVRVIGTQPLDTSINIRPLVINKVPLQSFSINGPQTICSGNTATYFANQSDPATTYTWTLTTGSSMVTNRDTAVVSWNTPREYYLNLASSNVCGPGFAISLIVNVKPPIPINAPIITNTGRWLYATQTPIPAGSTLQWLNNGVVISGAASTSYYAAAAGNYTARFVNSCGEGPVSNAILFTNTSTPQTITFPVITDKTFGDAPVLLTATASSGLPVSYTVISGPGIIPANTLTITGTGVITIRAQQPGDGVYDTAAPVTRSFTVNKASQTITFPVISDTVYASAPITLSSNASSGLPVSYTVVSGPATLNGDQLTLTASGQVTVRASQPGNNNYLAAGSVDRVFCVRVPSLTSVISGPNNICPANPVNYSVVNVPGAVYTWKIVGGSTLSSTTNTVNFSWPTPGLYTLTVSAAGACGPASEVSTLQVNVLTSAQPDSVNTMLPVNNAVNLQLPLTLSWIPHNPSLYYTYDVYIWRADQAQPSSPTVANLASVNYTIPLSSGLAYNTPYKWMVVAKNGSCTPINTGNIQQFSLIPLPDLEVINVQAPATAFSGQSIGVTWTVKNNGPGNTQLNQHWTDAVLIATDSILDFTNPAGQLAFPVIPLLVKSVSNQSALNSGQSYTNAATFSLPIDYSGPLYVHVITDYAAVNGGILQTTRHNDSSYALPATVVTLSPTPDLQVDSVRSPNNTFSGSTVNVTYKVTNHGANAAGAWADKIYISKDPLFNLNTATLLHQPIATGAYVPVGAGQVAHTGGLLQDSSYTKSVAVVIPNFIFGTHFIYVVTDANNEVYEGSLNNNNTGQGNAFQVFLTPTPRLTVSSIVAPSTASITQSIGFSWNIFNAGSYDNIQKTAFPAGGGPATWGYSPWTDKVYLSTDPDTLIIGNAYLVGSLAQTQIITPETTYPGQLNFQVPADFVPGAYYVYVYTNSDKTVFEFPGTPQIGRSAAPINMVRPDLTVSTVTAPATVSSGQLIDLSYAVLNNGPGAVYNRSRKDRIYISNSSTFNASAQAIDSVNVTSTFSAGASLNFQKQVMIPNGISGTRYLFVMTNADYAFGETSTANNTNTTGAAVTVSLSPSPDFVVSAINIPDTVVSVIGFPMSYTVTNTGTAVATGNWKDSLFVSCNPVFNPASVYAVATRDQQRFIPVGVSYTDTFNLAIPYTFNLGTQGCPTADTSTVHFFVKTNAGNTVFELTPTNNRNSVQKTVINPLVDHVAMYVNSADTLTVGLNFTSQWSVKNLGRNPNDPGYSIWADGIYLSTDSVFNNNAVRAGFKYVQRRLNTGESYTEASATMITPVMPTGDYYVFMRTNQDNNILTERNFNNNTVVRRNAAGAAMKVHVINRPPADISPVITLAPATQALGQPITIAYRVTNNGVGTTSPGVWHDQVWLSNSFEPTGIYLGGLIQNRVLAPGQFYTDTLRTTLPINIPVANYTIVVWTNYNKSMLESDYTNNRTYSYVNTYLAAPADLIVKSTSVADTVVLGKNASFTWKLGNSGVNPATGFETDALYLSKDSSSNVLNTDILQLTQLNQLSVLPGDSTPVTTTKLVRDVIEGDYYVKVKTDILNNILETNKDNNTRVHSKKVYVKVNELLLATPVDDTLQSSSNLYYKLRIPASLRGATIQIVLKTNDSTTANNQLYVGLGYLPSAARFDYTFENPNAGNQLLMMTSVTDSVYYVMVKGSKPGNAYQLVKLTATNLPFAIVSVDKNSGGNTGNVTVMIKGSLFATGMTARIKGPTNNIITASAVYFINSTSIYATFNLQGAPLGVYDVLLEKPDLTNTMATQAFTVVVGNNGGLITGTGPNTGQTGSGNEPGCDPGAASGLNSQLQVEIIIPPKVFVSWPFVIQVNYTNASNVDIPAQVRIMYSLDGLPLALTPEGIADGKTSLYLEVAETGGPPNIIRAGGTGTLKVYSKAPASATAHQKIHFKLQ